MRHEIACGHQCNRVVEMGTDESGEPLMIPLCLSDKADGREETQVKHRSAKTPSPVCGPSIDGRSCKEMVAPNDIPGSFHSVLKKMGVEIDLENPHGGKTSRSC